MKRTPPARALACGYVRMSSAKQESSPAQQQKEIVALARQKGYELVAWYADESISGDEIEKRPDFCRMLADTQKGKFQVILCWGQDRFGRFDSLKAGFVVEPLRAAGVHLVTVTQGEIDGNDFAGRMMYAIQQEGKNQFLLNLSATTLRGRMRFNHVGNGTFGGSEPIVVENAHPALIDEAPFRKGPAKLARRAIKGRSRSNDYLLSGLLICGHGGTRMHGALARAASGLRCYAGYLNHEVGGCGPQQSFKIQKEPLERFVIGTVVELLHAPEVAERLREAVSRKLQAKPKAAESAKGLQARTAGSEPG